MFRSRGGLVFTVALVAFLLGAVLLLGCQPAQPAATPKSVEKGVVAPTKATEKAVEKPVRGGTLRAAVGEYPTLDPQAGVDTNSTSLIFESYVYTNEKYEVTKEGLFRDWTISPDGKTFTFKLREGVKFHDGTDFDAAAVKFNMERVKDPATKSPHRDFFAFVTSVEVVDKLTAKFNLSQPDAMLLAALGSRGGNVVSPAAVKKHGEEFARNPVGTGPFQFVEWALGDHITVKRFDGYWKKDKEGNRLPYLDGVVFRVITDEVAAAASIRTGQNDASRNFMREQWPLIKNDPNFVVEIIPSLTVQLVMLNTKRPPFDNKALREAVALAVDREGIAAVAGEGSPVHASVMTPSFPAFYDPKVGVFPARDVAKAKAKMAEAGYPGGGGLKVSLPTGTGAQSIKINEVLKANLAEIGIQADIETMGSTEYLSRVLSQDGEAKYRIMYYMTPTGNPEVGHSFNTFLHSRGARNNLGPYSNPQVDKLIDQARATYDGKERARLYQQAATVIRDDVPVVPLFINSQLTVTNKKIRGIVYNQVLSTISYNGFAEAWLAQ